MWIPDRFRLPARPGELREEMAAYEVIVRNDGESDAVIFSELRSQRPPAPQIAPI